MYGRGFLIQETLILAPWLGNLVLPPTCEEQELFGGSELLSTLPFLNVKLVKLEPEVTRSAETEFFYDFC